METVVLSSYGEEFTPGPTFIGEQVTKEEQAWRQDTSLTDGSIIRRLGAVESYQMALQKLDFMRGIVLTSRYTLPARFTFHNSQHELVATFERSVARVVLKHPHMHVGLVGEDTNKPCWIRLNSINLQKHIEWRVEKGDTDEFEEVFKDISYQQLDTKFTNYRTTPGWRIKVLYQEGADFIEVFLVFNHANINGGSAKVFHRDLLQSLHDDPQIREDDSLRNHVLTLPENSITTLSPPPEYLVQFPVEPSYMLKFLQEEVQTPSSKYPRTPMQAHWAPIEIAPFKTQFRRITVSNCFLAMQLRACRHHGTTLTGLLHALALVSLAPLLEAPKASAFGSWTAVDIRRFLPSHHPSYPWFEPQHAMSNYVTLANHMFDEELVGRIRSKNSLHVSRDIGSDTLMDIIWPAARKVCCDIKTKMDQGTSNDMIGFSQAIGDWRAQLGEEIQRPRRTSWVITNLGLIDANSTILPSARDANVEAEPGPTWSITRTQFIMCAHVVSSAFGISVAAIKGGDLVITCSWQDCVIDSNLGEGFVANMEKWLRFKTLYQDCSPIPENRLNTLSL